MCGADSAEFKTDPGSYRDMCIILLGNLSYLARIYTDHGKQAMLVKHVRCNLTRGRGGAWSRDRERVGKSERRVCLISTT